jgi:hypothetical protein
MSICLQKVLCRCKSFDHELHHQTACWQPNKTKGRREEKQDKVSGVNNGSRGRERILFSKQMGLKEEAGPGQEG